MYSETEQKHEDYFRLARNPDFEKRVSQAAEQAIQEMDKVVANQVKRLYVPTIFAKTVNYVLLAFSANPLDFGWYVVVNAWSTSNIRIMPWCRLLVNCDPWSVTMSLGVPWLATYSITFWRHASASRVRSGYASTYFENASTMIRMYSWPAAVIGDNFNMSMCTRCPGAVGTSNFPISG